MGDLNLHPPEHPRFPSNAEALQDPHRNPTEHEQRILDVFMRYKEIPDFGRLEPPTIHRTAEAERRIEAIAESAPDPLRDQDDRVLELLSLIADFPEVFGNVGYFLAAEDMNAARNNIQTSEFRRVF